MTEREPDLVLQYVVDDDQDDIEAHAVYCQCDECAPDRRHDQLEAA